MYTLKKCISLKLIVQLAEQIAHNDLDVGSSPTKLTLKMQFNSKNYQIYKTKKYLKENNFLFFSVGANQKFKNLLDLDQNLCKLNLNYYKIYNNITTKVLKNSAYQNISKTLNSTMFFIKPLVNDKLLTKNSLASILNPTFFTLLKVKLHKKIYLITQLKNLKSFNYIKNISIMYQFLVMNLKFFSPLQKIN